MRSGAITVLIVTVVFTCCYSVLASNDVQVYGRVVKYNGEPIRKALVAAVEDPSGWSLQSQTVHQRTLTDASGKFRLMISSRALRRVHLVAVGKVRTSRRADGTIVYTGTSVTFANRISATGANVIIVPNDFVPRR